ncbi:PREDICTED: inhibitor of growth protein 4-like [Amphimedon queenslandica]|uniref:Inhibitor of growth protein n=1 Tax=Amphimedon queenslandica TaxID=400682 RepID=A0A1X7VPT1_AMPQE|nr:PREDICTED: inhibitor of growth protein 4-like [Amphimedon queenslandica]|eukprot:XP_019858726.1 PREDICTED: inhibitor of growth protein 4-like [Amphimedon queenslandica]
MAARAFLEQYMECTDSLPLDVQRLVSQYKELDYKATDLLDEARQLKNEHSTVLKSVGVADRIHWLLKLQKAMVSLTEVGDQKLEVTSEMLDTAEEYTQQLELASKEVDNCRTRDDLSGGSRNSFVYKNSSLTNIHHDYNERKRNERHHKRSRVTVVQDHIEEDSPPLPPIAENPIKEAPVPMTTSSSSSSTAASKPTKKKVKIKKRSSNVSNASSSTGNSGKDSGVLLPVGGAIPQPDFNSEPIDPDEPTYCLCNQVSFGEMIGCDNEECSIEWFHFVCVGLTSKPKGKWYCPQCSKERSKHRSNKS